MADTERLDAEKSKATAWAGTGAPPTTVDAFPAPAAPALSKTPDEEEEASTKVNAKPEREPKPADYFRVFTYAKPFDVACFVAAALASGCAGVVGAPQILFLPPVSRDCSHYHFDRLSP